MVFSFVVLMISIIFLLMIFLVDCFNSYYLFDLDVVMSIGLEQLYSDSVIDIAFT